MITINIFFLSFQYMYITNTTTIFFLTQQSLMVT